MAKHSENCTKDSTYGEMIARQGVRLVYLENRVKELEDQLLQERINHIENLQNIKYVAENNIQASQSNILGVIAGIIMETLEQLTGGIIQNKKEKNFYIDQDTQTLLFRVFKKYPYIYFIKYMFYCQELQRKECKSM